MGATRNAVGAQLAVLTVVAAIACDNQDSALSANSATSVGSGGDSTSHMATAAGGDATMNGSGVGGGSSAAGAGGDAGDCGDGVLDAGESCDDANGDNADGCSEHCAQEAGWRCRGEPSECLPHWPLDLVAWVDALVEAAAGANSEGFKVPARAEINAFADASDALMNDAWSDAAASASSVGYQAVLLEDTGSAPALLLALVPATWTVLQPQGGSGRGVYLARKAESSRQLVLQAPHIHHDLRSGNVAALAFRELNARALTIAGTHRCANQAASSCSGTTSACGALPQPYRTSDMAHNTNSFFQAFHEAADPGQTLTFLQVHGMGSGPSDPIASISDGTSSDVGDERYLSNRLASALEAVANSAGSSKSASSCNRASDSNLLCGSTNTQGRFSNEVASASLCTESSSGFASGRFVHAELALELRDPASTVGPQAFIDALAQVFPQAP